MRTLQHRREIIILIVCFLVLSVLSVARQFWLHAGGMQFTPVEATVIFSVYAALLNVWWGSIRSRVAQKPVRRFLTVGHWLTVAWFVVRLLQNGIVPGAERYGRFSGYLLAVPVVYGFLMNFYASLLLGKADDARLDRRWYVLLIPTTLIVIGYLTNNYHSFMNTEVPVDAGASNRYRVNIGSVLTGAWIVAMELLKIVNVMRSGRHISNRFLKLLPILELVLLIAYTAPYVAIDFAPPKVEFIEYTAGLFFYEILVWETCILIGVLPVNTDYREIFHCSDIGMQILHPDGEVFVQSKAAYPLDAKLLQHLKQDKTVVLPDGMTLQIMPMKDGDTVFHSDTREVQRLAEELQEKKASLESKGVCLREELATRRALRHIREKQRLFSIVFAQTEADRQEIMKVLQAMRVELAEQAEQSDSDAVRDLLDQFCRIALEIKTKGNQILEQEYQNEADHEA